MIVGNSSQFIDGALPIMIFGSFVKLSCLLELVLELSLFSKGTCFCIEFMEKNFALGEKGWVTF